MKIFGKTRFKHYDLLMSLQTELVEDCETHANAYIESGLIGDSRLFVFLVSFNLACYAIYCKETDRDSMHRYVTEKCNIYIKTTHSNASSDRIDELFDQLIYLIETCQDEYIEIFVADAIMDKYGGLSKAGGGPQKLDNMISSESDQIERI